MEYGRCTLERTRKVKIVSTGRSRGLERRIYNQYLVDISFIPTFQFRLMQPLVNHAEPKTPDSMLSHGFQFDIRYNTRAMSLSISATITQRKRKYNATRGASTFPVPADYCPHPSIYLLPHSQLLQYSALVGFSSGFFGST